jgi:hypothetical protein
MIAFPLVETGTVSKDTGITAIGFFIGGIVCAILVVLFVKPGVVYSPKQ